MEVSRRKYVIDDFQFLVLWSYSRAGALQLNFFMLIAETFDIRAITYSHAKDFILL